MPRYKYYCEACKVSQIIFHRISEKITICPACKAQDQLKKMLTTPHIASPTDATENNDLAVGELTKEYIEANRDILKQEKEKAQKETYEPS